MSEFSSIDDWNKAAALSWVISDITNHIAAILLNISVPLNRKEHPYEIRQLQNFIVEYYMLAHVLPDYLSKGMYPNIYKTDVESLLMTASFKKGS